MDPLLSKLTIAIPVYNDARYLAATLESCVLQAGHVVIYDNQSNDGSERIAADFAARYPHVTHVRHPENIGAFGNFKAGLDACQTEYFCWVGSHDVLSDPYSLPLLQALEADADTALAVPLIVHIDEHGKRHGLVTRTHWANEARDKSPLERAGACMAGLHRDCSMFYAVFRTECARRAWFEPPCLGFDRAMLVRTAAIGKMVYVPGVTFFARNLDKSRDARTDRDRRASIVGRGQALPKNVFTRNMVMIRTLLDNAHTPDELSRALFFIDRINHRYQNRRYFQKQRWLMIVMVVLLVFAYALAWYG